MFFCFQVAFPRLVGSYDKLPLGMYKCVNVYVCIMPCNEMVSYPG